MNIQMMSSKHSRTIAELMELGESRKCWPMKTKYYQEDGLAVLCAKTGLFQAIELQNIEFINQLVINQKQLML